MTDSSMAEIARWNAERNEVLRSLDLEKFVEFWERHHLPVPEGGWIDPIVPLIMMHKCRLQVTAMTEEEKQVSREWLRSHNYRLEVYPWLKS